MKPVIVDKSFPPALPTQLLNNWSGRKVQREAKLSRTIGEVFVSARMDQRENQQRQIRDASTWLLLLDKSG